MAEIGSNITVNYNFDLEDDDFFADNFLSSISENDLLTSTAIPKITNGETLEKPKEAVQPQDNNNQQIISSSKYFNSNIEDNENEEFNKSNSVFSNKIIESAKQDDQVSLLSPIQDSSKESLNVNSRFVPGFTPKARKRKFPGPAGVYTQQNKLQILSPDHEETCKEKLEDLEVHDITSSQFTTNDLLLPSWQNLQKDVSSCQTLLSTAKYHSIHRVLNEASKKKLPKHVVVPVLCVLIKKFNPEDSSLVLIDDTGEMAGKIYKDVLEEYKELIKVGSALILRKVTYLCNVLLLKKPCIASIYLEDGTVKHVCELTSILDKEPLKQMGCGCPGTPKRNVNTIDSILKMCDASLNAGGKSNNLSMRKGAAGCSSSGLEGLESKTPSNTLGLESNTPSKTSGLESKTPVPAKQGSKYSCNTTNSPWPCNTEILNPSKEPKTYSGVIHSSSTMSNIQLGPDVLEPNKVIPEGVSSAAIKNSNEFSGESSNKEDFTILCSSANINSGSELPLKSHKLVPELVTEISTGESEDVFGNDFENDEFDELLGSLDEKSFLT